MGFHLNGQSALVAQAFRDRSLPNPLHGLAVLSLPLPKALPMTRMPLASHIWPREWFTMGLCPWANRRYRKGSR
jgi:hypothetical protein